MGSMLLFWIIVFAGLYLIGKISEFIDSVKTKKESTKGSGTVQVESRDPYFIDTLNAKNFKDDCSWKSENQKLIQRNNLKKEE